MPAAFLWFLFDWRGRISRSAYRRAALILALFVGALQLAPESLQPILTGVIALQIVVQAALDAKRLHDIGMSAGWVPMTSLVAIGGAAALGLAYPQAMALMSDQLAGTISKDFAGMAPVVIVLSGVGFAAFVRSTLLWMPNSNAAGDVYAYDPLRGKIEAASADGPSKLDADALIAQALAEQRTRALEAKLDEMQRVDASTKGARKTFGRRVA